MSKISFPPSLKKLLSSLPNIETRMLPLLRVLASKAAAPGIGEEAPTAICPNPSKFLEMALIRISSSNTVDIKFYSAASALLL